VRQEKHSDWKRRKLEQLDNVKADIRRNIDSGKDITELIAQKNILKNEINGRL
jgi:hypothetical protein